LVAVAILEGLQRLQPVRRLSRSECDLLGYEGPLVLSVRQVRWLIGPWRTTKDYVVVRHPNTIVMECTKAELQELGVDPESARPVGPGGEERA
jgi:hypothetical protein